MIYNQTMNIEKLYDQPRSSLTDQEKRAPLKFCLNKVKLPNGTIGLDIGSNKGIGLAVPDVQKIHLIASDINPSFLKDAKLNGFQNHNVVLDTKNLPFISGSLGFVSMFQVLEHIPKANQDSVIGEIQRILNPQNGILFLSTPNVDSRPQWSPPYSPDHLHELNRHELQTLLERHFSKVELFGQRFLQKGIKWYLYHIARSSKLNDIYFNYLPSYLELFLRNRLLKSQKADVIKEIEQKDIPRSIVAICRI